MKLSEQILQKLAEVIQTDEEFVLLHGPYIPPSAWDYTKECLDTGWVSSAGSYVTKFEEMLASVTGCKRAVATVNGTAALEICLRLAGVQPNDEVICPSLTFVATANAISHCQAIPHFVDVSEERFSICAESLKTRLQKIVRMGGSRAANRETGRTIGAVCLMHCFGHPGEIDAISEICNNYNIPLVEDAAESLGSYYHEKHTGRFGKLSAVSFNGNKIVTTGGGGAILTDDNELADRAKHLTTTAKLPHKWEFSHDAVAWNYRMPNLNAALGVAQLEMLSDILSAKRELAQAYSAAFDEFNEFRFLTEPTDSQSNYWLNCIVLDPAYEEQRDDILNQLNNASYQCRPIWQPMHQLPMFQDCPRGELTRTESLVRRAINIPSSAYLRDSNLLGSNR